MADDIQVKCINKTDRQSAHERISHIGGVNPDKSRWRLTLDEAIKGIEDGKWRFYVSVGGHSVWVVIAKTGQGHKYLKTEADEEEENNLLSLPECPE
ncbi:MAG TPA: DUF3892 domain-containing protein [Thermoanaerobaculaceae bacterium]|nr:DUF3892 domain-containing protein [Thermoanaerobaculaceae bacterium]